MKENAPKKIRFQTVVTAAQRAVAQLQPLVKDLPELVDVAAGGQSHVRQVDGDAGVRAGDVPGGPAGQGREMALDLGLCPAHQPDRRYGQRHTHHGLAGLRRCVK